MNRGNWRLPNWQGFCSRGGSVAEQKKRLAEVPAEFKEQVRRHLITVFKINKGKGDSNKKPTCK